MTLTDEVVAAPPYGGLTALDLDPPPRAWEVHTFASRGTVTLLTAPTGAGKTVLALQIAAALATAEDVAGMTCRRGRALYLDAENGSAIMAERVKASHLDREGFDYVDLRRHRGGRIDATAGLDELACALEYWRPSLAVLDSLRRLAPSSNEDSSEDMASVVGGLGQVAHDTNTALVLIHHQSNKRNAAKVRGSSAIEDQCDTSFYLERLPKAGAEMRRLRPSEKYRLAAPPEDRRLRLLADPLRFVGLDSPAQRPLDAELDLLAASVRGDGSWPTAQLGAAVGLDTKQEGDRKKLGRALARLVESGRWVKPRHGHYAPAGE